MNTEQAFCEPAVHISDRGLNSQKDKIYQKSVGPGGVNQTSGD